MSDRLHKKPIGETGKVRVTHSKGEPIVTWEPIRFPTGKAEQELVVASTFAKELSTNEGTDWIVEQLNENNFDFALRSSTESRYLELQEIIIPPPKRGTPYASREQVIQSRKFSETIILGIQRKALKYRRGTDYALDLLVYPTHWRFMTSETVRQAVAKYLKDNIHPFAHVFEFSIFDRTSGLIQVLFPNEERSKSFSPQNIAKHRYVNFDPAIRKPVKDEDGSIGVSFDLSSEALKKLFGSDYPPSAGGRTSTL